MPARSVQYFLHRILFDLSIGEMVVEVKDTG